MVRVHRHIRGRFEAREEPDGEAAWEAPWSIRRSRSCSPTSACRAWTATACSGRLRASKLPQVRDLPVVIISGDDESARARSPSAPTASSPGHGRSRAARHADVAAAPVQGAGRTRAQPRRARAPEPGRPESGLATEAHLEHHGAQAVAEARRRQADIGAMVIEIDQFDELATRYGVQVVQLIPRKLGKLEASGRIRAEDTLSQHGQACFALLSPGIDRVSTCAFALRLRASVEKLVMAFTATSASA